MSADSRLLRAGSADTDLSPPVSARPGVSASGNEPSPTHPATYYSNSASTTEPLQISSLRETYFPLVRRPLPRYMRPPTPYSVEGDGDVNLDSSNGSTNQQNSSSSSFLTSSTSDLQSSTHQSLERLRRILQHNSSLPQIHYREHYSEARESSFRQLSRRQHSTQAPLSRWNTGYSSSSAGGGSNSSFVESERREYERYANERYDSVPSRSTDPVRFGAANSATRLMIPLPHVSSSSVLSLRDPHPYTRSPLRRSNTIRRPVNTYLESAAKRRRKDDEVLLQSASDKPHQLEMKMMYCDGGWHGDDYLPENVLSLSDSVYCSQKSKCNMILRHVSDKAFILHSITIKAPTTGFTCPVQQGLIFVSMNKDDLLPRTKYHDQQIDNMAMSASSSMTSEYPIRREYSGMRDHSGLRFLQSVASSRYAVSNPSLLAFDTFLDDLVDGRGDTYPGRSLDSTNLTDDEEDYEIEHYEENDDDNAMNYGTISDSALNSYPLERARVYGHEGRFYRGQSGQSRIINTDDISTLPDENVADSGGIAPAWAPESLGSVDPEQKDADSRATTSLPHTDALILEPVAKFKIPDHRSKCTITFDTPLSAKYVYIKFYSSDPGRNIDTQGVYIHGFIGPQCFPKISLRYALEKLFLELGTKNTSAYLLDRLL